MAVKRSPRTATDKVLSSAKLKTLQDSLNKNKRLRSQFIADPGAVLRAHGVEIGAAREQQVSRYLANLTAPQRNAFEVQLTGFKRRPPRPPSIVVVGPDRPPS